MIASDNDDLETVNARVCACDNDDLETVNCWHACVGRVDLDVRAWLSQQ